MHSDALIILLRLLRLDLLLLTKTKLIPSPTVQSRGGKNNSIPSHSVWLSAALGLLLQVPQAQRCLLRGRKREGGGG